MNELSKNQLHYLNMRRRHKRIVAVSRVSILLAFLFLWEFAANTGLIDSFIFSSPSGILKTLAVMSGDGSLFLHTKVTLYETLVSFLLVIGISFLTATLLWIFPTVSEILEPWLVVLNSLPKSALAPLLIVWLGSGSCTIIVAGMSVAVFGSIISMYTAFRETDSEKIKLIHTLGGGKREALCYVIFPSSLPSVISILKVNIGLCLVGVIIGEFLAAREGLGYLIIYASQIFKLNYLITALMVLCLIALILYTVIQKFEHQIKRSRS